MVPVTSFTTVPMNPLRRAAIILALMVFMVLAVWFAEVGWDAINLPAGPNGI